MWRHVLVLVALACLAVSARAGTEPAKVWIDGHDIDGPPPGPEHVPVSLGASVWPTGVSSKIRAERGGEAAVDTHVKDVTGLSGSVFWQNGFWRAQVDLFQLNQVTLDPFLISGRAFALGSKLTQIDVAFRASRELYRFDLLGGHYHLDAGLRYTLAGASFENNGTVQGRTEGFLCPEVILHGIRTIDERSAIHTRTSIATNGATTGRETSVEFAMSLNYHLLQTEDGVHDVSIGVRGLTSSYGLTDKATGQETTITNTYLGPELSYACRW